MSTQPFLFLVDDDLDDQELFREAIENIQADVACLTAKDGPTALRQMQDPSFPPPALIFIDVNMPRMNGSELLTAIKAMEKFKEVPIIMYSTASVQEEIAHLRQLGAALFLVKEVSFTGLCRQLEEVLVKYQLHAGSS